MRIDVSGVSDRGGGDIGPIGEILLRDAPDLGDPLEVVEVTLVHPAVADEAQWLDRFQEAFGVDITEAGLAPGDFGITEIAREHEARRASLPRVTMQRTKRRAFIEIASEVPPESLDPSGSLTAAQLRTLAGEVVGALRLLGAFLTPADQVDLPALLAHCEWVIGTLPTRDEEVARLLDVTAAAQPSSSATGWDFVDVDWEEFHPRARELLDDPFFWDPADDVAPHGNDTGADLLEEMKERLGDSDAGSFTETTLRGWGLPAEALDDDLVGLSGDEACIAAAFGEIKLRGRLSRRLAAEALASVAAQRRRSVAWADPEDCATKLDKMAAVLRSYA
ncbi:hypothetical protein [Cumulibacter manganitolerans]|uniref:hypothetical protein n=1 Tax=Cumulibacter manganitolerans TaxID=1884992 RepID=UPI001297BE66|nr:hypothetical protein [Cumulibacter manganitolerans]